jgi:hypothetical protein
LLVFTPNSKIRAETKTDLWCTLYNLESESQTNSKKQTKDSEGLPVQGSFVCFEKSKFSKSSQRNLDLNSQLVFGIVYFHTGPCWYKYTERVCPTVTFMHPSVNQLGACSGMSDRLPPGVGIVTAIAIYVYIYQINELSITGNCSQTTNKNETNYLSASYLGLGD